MKMISFWCYVLLFLNIPVYLPVCKGNEFFNCLENNEHSHSKHCIKAVNKWNRLPNFVRPLKYRITLQPFIHYYNEKDFYFRGSVSIECESERSLRHVMIHSGKNINFRKSKLRITNYDKRPIRILSVFYISSRKWLVITLDETLPANQPFDIRIKRFYSKFEKKTNGFYFFHHKINKEKRYGANVLLSPFYAKNVFPCFDDPLFETSIQLNIIHKESFVSQSITNIIETKKLRDGWLVDMYEWTPEMQIYQFTFSINTFSYITDYSSQGHLIRMWAPEEKLKLCKFSMNILRKSLDFYEEYFNSTYVFDKLDVVVTAKMPPYETGSSTYGLLIFLDSILFLEEDKLLPRYKQIYINTIHHEVAHQWIGNVLRMEWFDGLWIIEGLVGFMEQKINTHKSQYNHKLATALTQTLIGLFADDQKTNHRMAIYPFSAKHVEKFFDDLIFTKGFSLFKMIDGVIGEKNFQYALQTIVKDETIGPLRGNDLWHQMDKALKDRHLEVSILHIMNHWQTKRGYPVIQAKIINQRTIEVTQHGNHPDNRYFIWPVPITYLIKDGEEISDHRSIIWLSERSRRIRLKHKTGFDSWFILNQDQIGFYRVKYELSNWILLIHQLRVDHNMIPAIARLQILDDIFKYYCNGQIPGSQTILDVFSYLENETEYTIWKYSKTIFDLLKSFFDARPSYHYFKKFMNKLINNLLPEIQWRKSKRQSLTLQMRDKLMLTYACRFGHPYCRERTAGFFDYFVKEKYFSAPLHLYGPILCHGIKYAERHVWYEVLKSLQNPKLSYEQKLVIAKSLSCTRDENIIEDYWNIMSTNSTKYKDLYSELLGTLAKNTYSRRIFESRICGESVNITKNAFEFAATLAAMNNFMLPEECQGMYQIHQVRSKRSTGDNFEIETSLNMDETRKFLYYRHIESLERWLENNMSEI